MKFLPIIVITTGILLMQSLPSSAEQYYEIQAIAHGDPGRFKGIATGDFNNDGYDDIAATTFKNSAEHGAVFFSGNGQGELTRMQRQSRSGSSSSRLADPAIGDVNNDGKLDLVGFDTFSDITNPDAPAFYNQFPVGHEPLLSDVNHDGLIDVISRYSNHGLPGFRVYRNNGDFHFSSGTVYSVNFEGSFREMTMGDINNDGQSDVVIISETFASKNGTPLTYAVSVFLADNGGFSRSVEYSLYDFHADNAWLRNPVSKVALKDLDGDSFNDLVVVVGAVADLQKPAAVNVYRGFGDGQFSRTGIVSNIGNALQPRDITWADINDDGYPDLLSGNSRTTASVPDASVTLMTGNGDGSFAAAQSVWDKPVAAYSVATGEFDGDGKLDIVVFEAVRSISLLSRKPKSYSTPKCADSSTDPDGDGWGYENNTSCRVEAKFMVCRSSRSDTDGDGWGWENNASCKVASN
ncbi:hypothetical protein AB833_03240 [Chromatiales bacterium (ex Bugula neritina AB1)]|nr:hypothetical protein AB833_03240 [Chromatiales bacterium (ex Bugula neritina AB1)]